MFLQPFDSHFRLCNVAVWEKSAEHCHQCIHDQQVPHWVPSSPTCTQHPRANGLVSQIWTPLVASTEFWFAHWRRDLCSWECFHLQRVGIVVFISKNLYIRSNNFLGSLSILWMLCGVTYLNVYVMHHAVFLFMLPHTCHLREPIVFVLNAVYQPVYTICILYDNIYVNSLWLILGLFTFLPMHILCFVLFLHFDCFYVVHNVTILKQVAFICYFFVSYKTLC